MTTVVLLVLAGIWAAVIIAPMVRARAEGTPADSIGSFRRQLSVLERAAPSMVHPANRLYESGQAAIPPYRSQPTQAPAPRVAPTTAAAPSVAAPVAALHRHQLRKRRRDVFFSLVAGTSGSLLLSFLPGLHVMLFVFLPFALALAVYVGLLIRLRNIAAEREMKLRFLPRSGPAEVGGAGRAMAVGEPGTPAVLLRRSASS